MRMLSVLDSLLLNVFYKFEKLSSNIDGAIEVLWVPTVLHASCMYSIPSKAF